MADVKWEVAAGTFNDYSTPKIEKATQKVAEVRVKDPKTGGEKGSKLARFDLIPADAMWKVAEVYGEGAKKYAARNWERGYDWGLSIAALERHLSLFKQREDIDEETSCYHIAQVCWHALALLTFQLRGLGTDDRVKGGSLSGQAHAQSPVGGPEHVGSGTL